MVASDCLHAGELHSHPRAAGSEVAVQFGAALPRDLAPRRRPRFLQQASRRALIYVLYHGRLHLKTCVTHEPTAAHLKAPGYIGVEQYQHNTAKLVSQPIT